MILIRFVVTILWLVLFVWALLDILKAHKTLGWKLVWGLVCLAFPVAGTIVYYFFARQKDIQLPQDLRS